MRRAVVTTTATAAGVILLLSLKPHDAGNGPVQAIGAESDSGGSAPTPAATAASARSITGDAVNTRFGAVQVKVTLDGTKITKVDVVQYPSRDHKDQEINSYAIPLLNKEAIAAQSADIDVVSGATYTSDGYTKSLQSALDKAQQ